MKASPSKAYVTRYLCDLIPSDLDGVNVSARLRARTRIYAYALVLGCAPLHRLAWSIAVRRDPWG